MEPSTNLKNVACGLTRTIRNGEVASKQEARTLEMEAERFFGRTVGASTITNITVLYA